MEFDIEGADGPAPNRNTLLLDVNPIFSSETRPASYPSAPRRDPNHL